MNVNLTLYFTNRCNMDCSYCTQDKNAACMTEDVLHAACELAFSAGPHAGFCFFGGEPLLCENLIFEAMDLCAGLSAESGKPVYYRMTTNGTLLSQQMCDRAVREHMEIGLSFDGLMQNTCRKYADGTASFADVEAAAKRLLVSNTLPQYLRLPEPAGMRRRSGRFRISVRLRKNTDSFGGRNRRKSLRNRTHPV